ncbi:MAG TPA: hypothetical protein VLL05_06210 [Terriglobales bacterium]|nr:hypothetical protein [Terriglobales bacterium]
MFKTRKICFFAETLLTMFLAGSLMTATAVAQSAPAQDQPQQTPGAAAPDAIPPAPATPTHRRPRPNLPSKRAVEYYTLIWGVDSLRVKSVESGELIKFTYRVLDPDKAEVLNDKKSEPSLIDPQAGVRLEIPQLEKVGKLRQSSTPEAGKSYWMAFSNKGRIVKPGDHVDVVIGKFHADGLIVE